MLRVHLGPMAPNLVYVGTYTSPARGKGIVVFRQDRESGALTEVQTFAEVAHPSFLTFDPTGRFLFAVNEHGRNGEVSSFQVEKDTGVLTFLNRQPTMGGSPCHLCPDPSGKLLFVANYGSGSVVTLRILDDGKLEPVIDLRHHGEGALAHFVGFDPGGQFLLAVDKGKDRVFVYRPDVEKSLLIPVGSIALKAKSGPRHLAFHPKLPVVFVNGELDMSLTVLTWNAESGALAVGDRFETLPAGAKREGASTAEIAVHPTGKALYISNRGHNSLAVFRLSEAGAPSLSQHLTTPKNPRHFALDPSGKFLYLAGQNDDRIVGFKVDSETGDLSEAGIEAKTGSPVCLLFS